MKPVANPEAGAGSASSKQRKPYKDFANFTSTNNKRLRYHY
jgi:hypothetical protein